MSRRSSVSPSLTPSKVILAALVSCCPIPEAAQAQALEGLFIGPSLSHTSYQQTLRFPSEAVAPGPGVYAGRPAAQFNDVGGNTPFLGGRVGYSTVLADRWFLSGELSARLPLEAYPTTILQAAGYSYEASVRYEAGALLRGGVLLTPTTAVYGSLGVSHFRVSYTIDGVTSPRSHLVPQIGLGAETAFSPRWSARYDFLADRRSRDEPLDTTAVRWTNTLSIVYRF